MAYGSAMAGGAQVAATPRKMGELESLIQQLGSLINELDGSAGRIGSALDRLHGPRPQETQGGKDAPVAANALSELRDRLERLGRVSGWLASSAQRLDEM